MEAVFPAPGRRWRRQESRQRHRTTPVTFAEIKEVDEEMENEEACSESLVSVAGDRVERQPDLEREFAEFRRRRTRCGSERVAPAARVISSPPPLRPPTSASSPATAISEPPTLAPS